MTVQSGGSVSSVAFPGRSRLRPSHPRHDGLALEDFPRICFNSRYLGNGMGLEPKSKARWASGRK